MTERVDVITCKCGRTYDQHLIDRPPHVFQGFVWMTEEEDS